MENKQLKSKISSAAKWSTATEIIAKAITPITNMILARLLVPEAFGVIATITMIISFTDMFTDAGFQKYLVQKEFESEEEKHKSANVAFWTNLAISIFLWVIIIIFRNPISVAVGNPGLGNVIAIACVQLPLTSFSSIQMSLYRRDFNFKVLFYTRILTALIPCFVTIPLAMLGMDYWSLIIGSICGVLANAVILTAASKWKPSFYYNTALLKTMLSFSIWSLMEAVSIWLTSWVDVLIIGSAFNQYYLGLYKNSLNMVNSLMAIVTASVIPILFASLSRLQNNRAEYQKMYYTTQRLVAYIVFPMSVGLLIYKDLATGIMFGDKWSEASDIIGIWSLMAGLGIVFSNLNGEVYRSLGKPKISFIYQVIHLCFLIPGCIIAKGYGFWPLVYTRALMRIQGTITGFIFMKAFMGFSVKDMLKNIVKPLECTFIMVMAAAALRAVSSSVTWGIVSIVLCMIVYSAALMLLAKNDVKEFIKFGKLRVKRGKNQ